jgi:predicted TIM-barrel fold metal-dependent hydrolase
MGAPEFEAFMDLADRYPAVYLDTTMAFSDFFDNIAPFPRSLRPRLAAMGDRVVLGSDFPTIPYRYGHQLHALARLELGDDWLRAVCYRTPASLLGL